MPSIANGLFAGRAGIASHGIAIAVLGDNIANSSTTGYKASRADFTDLLAGNLGGGAGGLAVGSGSEVTSVKPVFTQGTLEFTGRGLDNAIDGNGFFVVSDTAGARYYTRAGNFAIDPNGDLRDQNGFSVLGFPATKQGIQPLNVRSLIQSDIATENVAVTGNLDASSNTGYNPATFPAAPTFAQLNTLAGFQNPVDVYDALGGKHAVNVFFFHDSTYVPTPAQITAGLSSRWDVRAYVDGEEVAGGTAGTPVQLGGTGTMFFANDGTQTTPASGTATIAAAVLPGAAPTWLNTAPSDATHAVNFNLDFTQYDNTSLANSVSQDGKGAGNVVSFSVQPDGTLFTQLDNGTTTSIGRLAMANFANPEGLDRRGDALFVQTLDSGEPVIGRPKTGQFGAIQAGALELSTSDIASDFIKLITLQRGFQGSSRIITSINELLNDVINLAR